MAVCPEGLSLFDPADDSHRPCVEVLKFIVEPLGTTALILAEAVHLRTPDQYRHKISFIIKAYHTQER